MLPWYRKECMIRFHLMFMFMLLKDLIVSNILTGSIPTTAEQTNPTAWNEIVYTGADFFEKMLAEKAGNVVVLSGNNKKKAEYISKSINAGFNVLADKPMIIDPKIFPHLSRIFRCKG